MPGRGKPFTKDNPGRPKGAVSHYSKSVKETVLTVFNDLQSDPKINLKKFAQDYPREFYAIAAKLIPTEVNTKMNKITLEIVRRTSAPSE